ncbi:hypothetical protein [Phyllobacterium sp. K27]
MNNWDKFLIAFCIATIAAGSFLAQSDYEINKSSVRIFSTAQEAARFE